MFKELLVTSVIFLLFTLHIWSWKVTHFSDLYWWRSCYIHFCVKSPLFLACLTFSYTNLYYFFYLEHISDSYWCHWMHFCLKLSLFLKYLSCNYNYVHGIKNYGNFPTFLCFFLWKLNCGTISDSITWRIN